MNECDFITCGRNRKRTIVGFSSLNSRVLHYFTLYLFCIDKIIRASNRAQITMLLAYLLQMLLDSKPGWMARFCRLVKTWDDRGFGLRDLGFSQSVAEDDFWDITLYHWIRSSWIFEGYLCTYMHGTTTKAVLDCHRFLESEEKGTTILWLYSRKDSAQRWKRPELPGLSLLERAIFAFTWNDEEKAEYSE